MKKTVFAVVIPLSILIGITIVIVVQHLAYEKVETQNVGSVTSTESTSSVRSCAAPSGWQLPEDIYSNLDESMISVLASSNYEDNVKWQYVLYDTFGTDMRHLTCEFADDTLPHPNENFTYVVKDSGGKSYLTWIDADNGYVQELDQ